jgi:ribulose-phosphate 3-epimerase
VAVNPATPVRFLEQVLPAIDLALVMSVDPGFGGQRFLEQSIGKLRELSRMIAEPGLTCDVEVDGGVGLGNARVCVEAGATVVVAGTSVFRAEGGIESGVGCMLESIGRRSGRHAAATDNQ